MCVARDDEQEIGRHVMRVKCCQAPSRDIKNEGKGAANAEARAREAAQVSVNSAATYTSHQRWLKVTGR